MRREGTLYTIIFSCVVCGICSVLVSGAAVGLKPRQEANKILDRQLKVLSVAGKIGEDESLSRTEIQERYAKYIEPRLVDLSTGAFYEGTEEDPSKYDQRAALKDPAKSTGAPENAAQVLRVPKLALIYLVKSDSGGIEEIILPIEGKGLWSMLYGYLALAADATTIKGIIFYEHGETPGLGGEVENPVWTAKWRDKQAFDEQGKPAITVVKGVAGDDPHKVDGLSGATLTSRGVTNLLAFWLGDNAFGPFLEKFREQQGS